MSVLERSKEIRRLTMECIASIGVGHVGGCLSLADVLSVLYTNHMNVDAKNPKMQGRDRLVISKGHAGPAWYATLCSFGFFGIDELRTLNKLGTTLPSHCNMELTKGVDMTTGSLGQGISNAVGMAIASKIVDDNARIFCIIGDGESQEGQVWEALMLAAHKKLDNLVIFLDNNKMQIDGMTDEICKMESFAEKAKAFGLNVLEVDGHDVVAIDKAIVQAKKVKGKPTYIILNTVKGKGVSFVEAIGLNNHNMPISQEQLAQALLELK